MLPPTAKIDGQRRKLLLALAASSLPLGLGAKAKSKTRIVIVGGGVAGLCALKILRSQLDETACDIRLIEPQTGYTPPFCEQAAFVQSDSRALVHHRPYPRSIQGLQIRARVAEIRPQQTSLVLDSGERLAYDLLLLAPGLQTVSSSIPNPMPGWFNDHSLLAFLQRLDALSDGSEIVLGVPQLPYRCPPAPYQRASLIAARLRAKGLHNCRITIVDDKNRFSLQAHFLKYWEQQLGGAVQWLAGDIHEGITAYHDAGIETAFGDFEGDLVLGLGMQRAPSWCQQAGLSDFTGFCPVNLSSMRSQQDASIYVLGDAAKAEPMPKAASSAQLHAQIACRDVLSRLGISSSPTGPMGTQCFAYASLEHAFYSRQAFSAMPDGQLSQQHETFSDWPLKLDALKQETRHARIWQDALLQAMGLQPLGAQAPIS